MLYINNVLLKVGLLSCVDSFIGVETLYMFYYFTALVYFTNREELLKQDAEILLFWKVKLTIYIWDFKQMHFLSFCTFVDITCFLSTVKSKKVKFTFKYELWIANIENVKA